MIPPYEMTALEDPSQIGSELPSGAGRIQDPSGDIRSFQFTPPSAEDAVAAQQAAAARATRYDIIKRNAEQEAEDRQVMADMMANARTEEAMKAVTAAKHFQAMRRFQRNVENARADGASVQDAEMMASKQFFVDMGNPAALQRMMEATMPVQPPSLHTDPGTGRQIWMTGKTGHPITEPKDDSSIVDNRIWQQKHAYAVMLQKQYDSGTDEERTALKPQIDSLMKELGTFETKPSPPAAAAHLPQPPKATAGNAAGAVSSRTLLRNKTNGSLQWYRGNPQDVPTDRFEVIQ